MGELSARQVKEIADALRGAFDPPRRGGSRPGAIGTPAAVLAMWDGLAEAFDSPGPEPGKLAWYRAWQASPIGQARREMAMLLAEVDCIGDPSGLTVERLDACRYGS